MVFRVISLTCSPNNQSNMSIYQNAFFQRLRRLIVVFLLSSTISSVSAQNESPIGRWDLTVDLGDKLVPSWLEVKLSGIKTLVGYFVAEGGSARPISKVNFVDGKISFSIPPQWEDTDKDMVFEAVLKGNKLTGTIVSSRGQRQTLTGERAPLLKRTSAVTWGEPIKIFNGLNLDGWHASEKKNQWVAENGILKSPQSGANIITDQKFNDFTLHIEFRYPEGSNSGVYLRGRYEIQVEDNRGQEPSSTFFGGIYGFITPNEMAAKAPGEWQTYDITLVGRRVTVVANGKKIITDQIIPGITGGALDSKEGEPGPIMLQGDHGPIEYRNIIITPAK
jgi:hypothetical protein